MQGGRLTFQGLGSDLVSSSGLRVELFLKTLGQSVGEAWQLSAKLEGLVSGHYQIEGGVLFNFFL